jgi:hypothetical protein
MRTANGVPLIGETLEERLESGQENLQALVSLVKRLGQAAREPIAHGACEDGKNCSGCQAVREAREFVMAMRA